MEPTEGRAQGAGRRIRAGSTASRTAAQAMKASRRRPAAATHALNAGFGLSSGLRQNAEPSRWPQGRSNLWALGIGARCGAIIHAVAAAVRQHALRQLGIGTDEFHFIAEGCAALLQDHVVLLLGLLLARQLSLQAALVGVRPSSLGPAAVPPGQLRWSPHDERTWRPWHLPGALRAICGGSNRCCSCATSRALRRASCASRSLRRTSPLSETVFPRAAAVLSQVLAEVPPVAVLLHAPRGA